MFYEENCLYKAGEVGLVEVERPQIEALDVRHSPYRSTCVCGSDLWALSTKTSKNIKIVGAEAIGMKSVRLLQRVKPGDFVIAPLLMDVG